MSVKAEQVRSKTPGAIRNGAASFLGLLESGELLTGAPTVLVQPDDGLLVVNNLARNAVVLELDKGNGETEIVAANQAVTFRVSGGRAGTSYVMTFACATSAGQTTQLPCVLEVKDQ